MKGKHFEKRGDILRINKKNFLKRFFCLHKFYADAPEGAHYPYSKVFTDSNDNIIIKCYRCDKTIEVKVSE